VVVKARRQEPAASSEAIASLADWTGAVPLAKASAALLDVAAELDLGEDEDDYEARKLKLLLTMLAWNLSLLPIAERREQMRSFFDDMERRHGREAAGREHEAAFAEFETTIEALIYRKMRLHPLDRRRLKDIDLIETADGYRVAVLSTVERS
jgi:hypothetical protein